MASPRGLDDDRPSKWKARQSQAGVASSLGESEEAGDVGEQRRHEGQSGMLAGRWREQIPTGSTATNPPNRFTSSPAFQRPDGSCDI